MSVNLSPSTTVGLHPQLVSYDVTKSNGVNIGFESVADRPPRDAKCPNSNFPCREYVGTPATSTFPDGRVEATPVEFGSVNLMPPTR